MAHHSSLLHCMVSSLAIFIEPSKLHYNYQ